MRLPWSLIKSNKLLWECFCYFLQKLEGRSEFGQDGESVAKLLSDTVAHQLVFILIKVDDDLDAYTVFETLNATGLELSATDLIKNYLFKMVRTPSDRAALQRRWRRVTDTVRPERFPEFLRYHLLCEQRKIRTQKLFKLVRERVKTAPEVFELLKALEGRAELFAALSDPTHEYWIDRKECRAHVRELVLFRSRQLTPVLFAAWEKFSPSDFQRVLRLICAIVFRYTVVAGRNTNELEPASHDAANAVLKDEAPGPAGVFQKLLSIYVTDEEFEQMFPLLELRTHGQRKKLARYILYKLESHLAQLSRDPEEDTGTIEHVLPENPDSEWSMKHEEARRLVYRLGNLTLLESGINRTIKNARFEQKLAEYGRSSYALSRQIAEHWPTQWNAEVIQARQLRLTKMAVHVWRSDFV